MKKSCLLLLLLVMTLYSWADITDDVIAAGLPVLSITTENQEEPTCDYIFAPEGCFGISTVNQNKVPGRAVLTVNGQKTFDSGDYVKGVSGMTIRIRGNTSAYYSSKKPYKIELEKKNDLLVRDNDKYNDKNWILIDEGNDGLNTLIGLKMNEIMGLGGWTPAYQFVNLFINDDYRGIYMLLESIRRNPDCRLNVDKKSGYIFESDAYWWKEDVYFSSDAGVKYTFKYPDSEDITPQQIDYIRQAVNAMEQSFGSGSYDDYIDVTSFATWILAHDILGTFDSAGANIYLTKYDSSDDTKIAMSTLWDFNSIMKTTNQWSRVRSDENFYFKQLFTDTNFTNTYWNIWQQKSDSIFMQMTDFIRKFAASETAAALQKSRPYDGQRWQYEPSTVNENIQQALTWFTERQQWMNNYYSPSSIHYPHFTIHHPLSTIHHPQHTIHNITGQRVDSRVPKPGIYIINGKKILISSAQASAQ